MGIDLRVVARCLVAFVSIVVVVVVVVLLKEKLFLAVVGPKTVVPVLFLRLRILSSICTQTRFPMRAHLVSSVYDP